VLSIAKGESAPWAGASSRPEDIRSCVKMLEVAPKHQETKVVLQGLGESFEAE